MPDKDPFGEPQDSDRTVIRPNPGGRRTAPLGAPFAPAAPPVAPQPQAEAFGIASAAPAPDAAPRVEAGLTGMNRLSAAAATLFSLISRIRNRAQHSDVPKLHQAVVAEVQAFENRALQAGIDAQDVKIARYAICATLDDVVLNTPWGEQSIWAQRSMVGSFHRETVGGDRFYDLLSRLEQDPARNIDLLEFLYMCLSMGFEGRLRVEQHGRERHRDIRRGLAEIIRKQRGDIAEDLSPAWAGVHVPHRALSAWKALWITGSLAALLLAGGFVTLSWLLGAESSAVMAQIAGIDKGAVAVLERPAPPPEEVPQVVPQVERIKGFLEREIADGIVSVFEEGNTVIVRLTGSGMFRSGSDQLQDGFKAPLARVTEALNSQEGPVIIVGHSDNVPIRTARFPSNTHLSLARAESVMAEVAKTLAEPSRLSAEGRADKSPIADNGTAAGRARNRRIEVVLMRRDDV